MEFYSVIKKEWNNAIFSGMDAKRDYHTKRSQSERKTNVQYHLYAESKRWHKGTCLQNRLTDRKNRLVVTKGERGLGKDGLGISG